MCDVHTVNKVLIASFRGRRSAKLVVEDAGFQIQWENDGMDEELMPVGRTLPVNPCLELLCSFRA